MKFFFINARPNNPAHTTMTYACPPLGILYIAASLKKVGVEVSVLDQTQATYTVENVVDWVMKGSPDILGISATSSSSLIAPKIAEEVKKRNPDTTVVFGNHHATHNAERLLKKYTCVDLVVRGEGEQTCLDLVQHFKGQKNLKDVLGITFRHHNHVVSNPDRPLIQDIDELPFPDRDLLDVEYHNTTIGINVAPKKFTTILSSRGCVFKCRFCSCASLARNTWRPRSIDNILDELHFLASEGYKQLMFVDDNLTLNQKRAMELCQRMRKERIDMQWIGEGRVDQCSYSLFRHMVKAGCRMLYFGVESASQKVLDYYNKGITPEQSREAIKLARNAGIDIIVGSFIVGAPYETRKEIQKTLDFTKELAIDVPQINLLQANPGTPLWEDFKNRGLLEEAKYWESGVYISDISQNALPRTKIMQLINDYYQNFLKNHRYILGQLWLTLKSSYRFSIVMNNISRMGTIMSIVRDLTSHQYTIA